MEKKQFNVNDDNITYMETMQGISNEEEEENSGSQSTTNLIQDYEPHTLKLSSVTGQRRRSLLPTYPFHKYDIRPPLLLLANVANIDRNLMHILSYTGENSIGTFQYCPFQFVFNKNHEFIESFLIDFYQKLYVNTSQRWKISSSLLDYNLIRLQKCMDIYSKQVGEAAIASIDELPMALEFYFQIDVDLFFMKTCNFRGSQPRLIRKRDEVEEGLLCEIEPYARFGIMPCNNNKCFLCKSEQLKSKVHNQSNDLPMIIQFSNKHIHQFINGYQAILNCSATCDTSNIIYALTCPCGEYDYIGSTAKSLHERIYEHREEGHRMIREFLIGSENMTTILNQDKRKIVLLKNQYDLLLYQHSTRCSYGLQRFLEKNPTYWCFIPQLARHVKADNEIYLASKNKNKNYNNKNPFNDITIHTEHFAAAVSQDQQQQSESQIIPLTTTTTTTAATSRKPMFFESIVIDLIRNKEETQQLVRNLPNPPQSYAFSLRQREQQTEFFQTKKDNNAFPSDFVDLYNYSVVAVLPLDCSRDLRKFIEALFITHTQTKLNLIGRLTHEDPVVVVYDNSMRGHWCSKLIHPLFKNYAIENL